MSYCLLDLSRDLISYVHEGQVEIVKLIIEKDAHNALASCLLAFANLVPAFVNSLPILPTSFSSPSSSPAFYSSSSGSWMKSDEEVIDMIELLLNHSGLQLSPAELERAWASSSPLSSKGLPLSVAVIASGRLSLFKWVRAKGFKSVFDLPMALSLNRLEIAAAILTDPMVVVTKTAEEKKPHFEYAYLLSDLVYAAVDSGQLEPLTFLLDRFPSTLKGLFSPQQFLLACANEVVDRRLLSFLVSTGVEIESVKGRVIPTLVLGKDEKANIRQSLSVAKKFVDLSECGKTISLRSIAEAVRFVWSLGCRFDMFDLREPFVYSMPTRLIDDIEAFEFLLERHTHSGRGISYAILQDILRCGSTDAVKVVLRLYPNLLNPTLDTEPGQLRMEISHLSNGHMEFFLREVIENHQFNLFKFLEAFCAAKESDKELFQSTVKVLVEGDGDSMDPLHFFLGEEHRFFIYLCDHDYRSALGTLLSSFSELFISFEAATGILRSRRCFEGKFFETIEQENTRSFLRKAEKDVRNYKAFIDWAQWFNSCKHDYLDD